MYMDEKVEEESSSDSDAWERDGASSPYARRKPYCKDLRRNRVNRQDSNRSSSSSVLGASIDLRRNRISRQESNRSSGSSILANSVELRRNWVIRQDSNRSSTSSFLANSVELRRNRVSQQESNRSSGSSLLASLQNYTSIIFSRQTSKNVTETDF